ncbi:hypothetical protein M426DRAFT_259348 [Hypoxylon sp. CI-4A]|nr:hypothetical protein M426DRAFT_259348 [Hypoxylon sp. CI-4A]
MPSHETFKFRKEARIMAKSQHKREEKHELLKQWVYSKFKPKRAPASGEKMDMTLMACQNNYTAAFEGITLNTMLGLMKKFYEVALNDFKAMSIEDHIAFVFDQLRAPVTPMSETTVTRAMVAVAQHQQNLVRTNFIACVSKVALLLQMPPSMKSDMKQCKYCFQMFIPLTGMTQTEGKLVEGSFQSPCVYHPGRLFNTIHDMPIEDRQPAVHEIRAWGAETWKWECCNGKLAKPGPLQRSQKTKREEAAEHERHHRMDEAVGCKKRPYHVAIDEYEPCEREPYRAPGYYRC